MSAPTPEAIEAAAREEIAKLKAHILDIAAHATPFGDIPDDPGYVGAYLVSAGSLHRALGRIGHTAPSCEAEAELRALTAAAPFIEAEALCTFIDKFQSLSPAEADIYINEVRWGITYILEGNNT